MNPNTLALAAIALSLLSVAACIAAYKFGHSRGVHDIVSQMHEVQREAGEGRGL